MTTNNKKGKRVSGAHFPNETLNVAIETAKAVYDNGGNDLDTETLATAMRYSPTSSSFQMKITSAVHFGLLTKEKNKLIVTELGKAIFNPVSEADLLNSLKVSFFNFSIFRKLYEKFSGKSLPDKLILENILVREYGISPASKKLACRIFLESAKSAKLVDDDKKTLTLNIQSQTVDVSESTKETLSTITNLVTPTVANLIKDIGSLKIISELWDKLKDNSVNEYEKKAVTLLESALNYATETQLTGTKLALKIMKDRLSNEGSKCMMTYFPYVEEAYQEDLILNTEKKEDSILNTSNVNKESE